jgi:hypothetical protein
MIVVKKVIPGWFSVVTNERLVVTVWKPGYVARSQFGRTVGITAIVAKIQLRHKKICLTTKLQVSRFVQRSGGNSSTCKKAKERSNSTVHVDIVVDIVVVVVVVVAADGV